MEQKKVKKGTAPPRYDEAFKAGAVRLVTEQGRQPTEVAKELGICIDTLRSWLKASGVEMGQASRQTENSSASGSWKRSFAVCANSWERKTRSSIS